ncbi:MAG TPA: hypothetical protein VGR54_03260 [Nitrosopumilaceae archaeon]|nr:hypothetical protein [Nitrosopumilaceae archaeon]
MSINLVQKDGLKLLAGFAICALLVVIGNNSTWNVFADGDTSASTDTSSSSDTSASTDTSASSGTASTDTSSTSESVVVNDAVNYGSEVTVADNSYSADVKNAYETYLSGAITDPNVVVNYEHAVQQAKADLAAAELKAQIEYTNKIARLGPAFDNG